jgi:hypothetical protein
MGLQKLLPHSHIFYKKHKRSVQVKTSINILYNKVARLNNYIASNVQTSYMLIEESTSTKLTQATK